MTNISTIIALLAMIIIYGVCLLGVRKYRVIDNLRKMRKVELIGVLLCFSIMFLGITMAVARSGITLDGGIISKGIVDVLSILFVGDVELISLFVLLITIMPAYIFQLLLIFEFEEKRNQIHTMLFYYAIIYALSVNLYAEMSLSIGNAVLYFLISVMIYYVVCALGMPRGKNTYIYLGLLGVFSVILFVIEGGLSWSLLISTIVIILECLSLSIFLGKSVILRNVFRRCGTIVLILLFIFINMIFPNNLIR